MNIIRLNKNRLLVICLLFIIGVCAIVPPIFSNATTSSTQTDITLNSTVGTNNVILSWNQVTHEKGVKGYYVYRATKSGGQTILPETDFPITGTSYTDTKVTSGTTYYYIVKPVLSDGYTGKSSNEVVTFYQGNTPTISLKATINTGNITLNWSNSNTTDVIGYYVFRSTQPGKQTNIPETDFWITGTSYTDTKVIPGTSYYYIVKPVMKNKSLGNSSNEVVMKSQNIYGTIRMSIGNAKMLANGKYIEIDPGKNTVPVLKDARTMLPVRALIEAMGGTVDYTSGEQKVTVKWNGKTVCVWIGKKAYTVDGVEKAMDVAPYFSDTGRTMLPMRFIIENLGGNIDWDGATLTATITYLFDNNGYYPSNPPEEAANNWSGLWFTDRGKMSLYQNGIYVNGTYGNNNTIEGVLSGNKLIGTYLENGIKGDIEFVISKDGESFDGKHSDMTDHNKKHNKKMKPWNGKREVDTLNKYLIKLPTPSDFNGTWIINGLGNVQIKQENNNLTFCMEAKNKIIGAVTNNKFTGTYNKGNKAYIIEMYLIEGNKEIIGHYGTSEKPKQDWNEFSGKIKKEKHDYKAPHSDWDWNSDWNWDHFDWKNFDWKNYDQKNFDWKDFDWENFDWENFDWKNYNWKHFDWENFDWEQFKCD